MKFRVIDNKTGKEADPYEIALHEEWAQRLCYCDMEGFAILEDGTLILVDECGQFEFCDPERFKVVFEEERPHGEWIDVNGDGSLWKCSNCNEKSCCRGNFCSDCGSDNRPRENNSYSMIINGKYSENVEYGTRVEIRKKEGE